MRLIKFFFLTLVLITILTYIIGFFLFEEFSTSHMVVEMGFVIAIPVCLVNSIFLYFTKNINRKQVKWLVSYLPIILLIIFLIFIPLNTAYTPLVMILSMLISNTIWNLT